MRRSVLIGTVLILALAQLVWGTTPAMLTYQGVLKDSNGDIVADGSYSVIFRLYDAETGGTAIPWSETHSVTTTDGVFSVVLGDALAGGQSFPGNGAYFDAPYWLEIEVGGAILSPRTRLTSAPYAMAARSVYGSWNEMGSRSRFGINVAGTADTTKAVVITQEGKVGIGTTLPDYPLHMLSDSGAYVNLSGYGDTYNYSGLMLESRTDGQYWQLLHRQWASRQNNFLIQYRDGATWGNYLSITPGGNVGIGTGTPSARLEVAGTIKADSVRIDTTVRWYTIPHVAFDAPSNVGRTDFNTYSNLANTDVEFMAPVHLPHGALVTQFQATVGDTAAGNMTMELRAYADNGAWWQLGQLNNSFINGLKTDSVAVNAYNGEVQNQWKAYYIKATWRVPPPEWMAGTFKPQDVYIRSARIKYTVDQPLP
ncbi:hypothetical protein ACFL6Q_02465 [Candidatus Neomarinimicrobiota bacterium]